MRNHPQTRGWRIEDRGWKSIPRVAVFAIIYHLSSILSTATLVQFPLSQMFAVTNYAKPFTLTAQFPEITDGTNIYVGTYTIVTPTGGTNPIVSLTPNNYLLTFQDARSALRFSVPSTNIVLNLLNLITNGLATYPNWNGTFTGNGGSLTNLVYGPMVTSGNGNVAVTPTTNAATGQVTYSVAATGGISSANSNTFTGNLNVGQVYGLGNASLLSSNQLIQEAVANVAGGSATNAIGLNGGTGTNINLTQTTTVDQQPMLYATPTWGIFYGDSITQGNYVTNGYCADLAMMGFRHFTVQDFGISSSHITDVSNLFWGSSYSGSRSYTNYPKAGTNVWVSFWIGINDCLYDSYPIDTNTWINSYTNMWWTAHTNGATSIVVFTIEDSLQLSATGEMNRALLNSLITQNALADNSWVTLMNNDLILPSTNATYFLYNPSANYGLHPTDYGHSLVAQALASQMVMSTNLSRGAYFAGPVWSATGFGGNGSNLLNVPVTLGNVAQGTNTTAAVGMLGIDGSGRVTSNAVPTSSGSTSSNNFVGSLNVGQVYGLGASATLNSNQIVAMATNRLASAAYSSATAFDAAGAAQNATNQLASGAFTTVGTAAMLSSNQILAMAAATGGAATNLALGVPVTGNNSSAAVMMLGVDATGKSTTNAVPTSGGSTSSNNFVGSLNVGQIYGLGNFLTNNESAQFNLNNMLTIGGAQLGSGETWFDVNGAAQLGGGSVLVSSAGQVKAVNFVATAGTFTGNGANLTNAPGSIVSAGANVSVTPSTNAATGQITYAVAASGGSGGSLSSTLTNATLAKITSVDQHPVLYATPTWGVLYGDTITQGNYVTNDYAADLLNLGWQHFMVTNCGISSSKLTDVSNDFFGSGYGGALCYTNWVGTPGTNAWVSFWIGINDCNTWPLDTNTWINSFTNMWWTAHTNGATVVVFTIADSTQLSSGGETNRAILNSLITQNATGDNAWVALLNNDLILPGTNSAYYLYNATAGYGVFPNDRGHSLVAQALASQLLLQTNLSRGAYFNGPVWSATGFGGSGSNLYNLPAAKVVGVLAPTNVPVNTVVNVGSGLTVASNSVGGVQTYTVGVGSIAAASPFLAQRVWAYMPSGSGTTLDGFGQTGSTSGTFSGLGQTGPDPYCIIMGTTAVAGNYSSIADNQKTIIAGKPLMLVWRAGLTNTTNVRVWLAVSDYATIAAGDVSRNAMGFLYSSTNNGDWKLVTQYSGAWQWTDTGIAADTNSHTFELSYDGSANVYGYIDSVCVATNTSDLLTTINPWSAFATVTTLTTATNGVRFMQFYGQQGF